MSPDRIPYLLAAIFGVREGTDWPPPPPDPSVALRLIEAVDTVLVHVSPREEKVIRMRFGLDRQGGGRVHTLREVADHFGISTTRIERIEAKGLRKLRHPSVSSLLKVFLAEDQPQHALELTPAIQTIKKLTPELIAHLKRNEEDLSNIDPYVFEHLVAEFLASRGFKDVQLVGRNPNTAADIDATLYIPQLDEEQRYFIEVKKWKDRVGVEVIDRVYGALIREQETRGWYAAMVVTSSEFTMMSKWGPLHRNMKGIYLKDRDDLLRWLRDYQQKEYGLWLPNPAKPTS